VIFNIPVAAWRFFARPGSDEKETYEKDTVSQDKERGENAINPGAKKRTSHNFQNVKKGTDNKKRKGDTDYNHSRQGNFITPETFEKNRCGLCKFYHYKISFSLSGQ
jgi:hypothetical protein